MWGRADRAVKLLGRNIPSILRMTEGVDLKLSRRLCVKPQEESRLQSKSQSPLRVPGYKPTDWEKRFLLWAGHFKKPEDIPETVSYLNAAAFLLCIAVKWSAKALLFLNDEVTKDKKAGFVSSFARNVFVTKYVPRIETVRAAKTTLRVKFSYVMIALTVVGCIIMVIRGKQAIKRHETLTNINLEKKAQWREERTAPAKP